MTFSRNTAVLSVAAIAVAALGLLYAVFDPATMPFPRCIVLTLTGFQCPGCGSQRAIHALLNGNPAAAWHYNAMLVVSLPLVVALLVASLFKRSIPRVYNALNSRYVILAVLVAVIAWTIVRNVWLRG